MICFKWRGAINSRRFIATKIDFMLFTKLSRKQLTGPFRQRHVGFMELEARKSLNSSILSQ